MESLLTNQQIMQKLFELTMLTQLSNDDKHHHGGRDAFRGQGKILLILNEHDNISQKDLAEEMGMTPQSTAEFVHKLEKKGYVKKNKSPEDARVSLVSLTDAGRENVSELSQTAPDGLKYISEKEKKDLLKILSKLVDGMREDFENKETDKNIIASMKHKIAMHVIDDHINKKN
jgi:DNA-binding MarR family transcriptional regulator